MAKVFVITDKENNLNGVITNVDENNVSINWEDDEVTNLTNEDLDALLETKNFEVEEVEIDEDTPAAASIHTHSSADANDGDADGNPKTRLDWIRQVVGNMANMDMESLVKIFNDQQAMVGGAPEHAGLDGKAGPNQASIQMKPSAAGVAESVVRLQKEEMDKLFGETELTEEFKSKISTLFETAVVVRLTEEVVKIQEAYDKKLEESVETLSKELIEGINDYFDHVVEEWLTENEVAIESTLRTELTLEFLDGLKNLFQEHYIDIPEERVDVYENLVKDVEDVKAKLNDSINESIEKDKIIKNLKKEMIVSEMSVGLTLPQREKLKTLTESTEFDSEENFKKNVKTIKEGFVDNKAKDSNILNENIHADPEKAASNDPAMKAIVEAIKRTSGKI